ncbi:unnamed protein product, partial [Mesorhabditis belari]|uniref:CHK kinase-like domain-containing protein n=1 Tax=Mesorhabditis belari TaxID=2138241 RepID=A0AAF3J6Z8_9BILA
MRNHSRSPIPEDPRNDTKMRTNPQMSVFTGERENSENDFTVDPSSLPGVHPIPRAFNRYIFSQLEPGEYYAKSSTQLLGPFANEPNESHLPSNEDFVIMRRMAKLPNGRLAFQKVAEVSCLGPETLGYMSTMRRVHLQWENPADKPTSVIIKLPNVTVASEAWSKSAENGHEMDDYGGDVITMMHNCETSVYNCLSKYPEFRLSIPFLYSALDVSTGTPIIVMEDLEKAITFDVAEGFNEKQLFAIVDELVKLHALSYKYDEVKNCGIKESTLTHMEQFQKLVLGVAEQLYKQNPEYLASVDVLIRNHLTKDWFQDLFEAIKSDPNTVLCHGDLWSPQILWKAEKIAAIVDWALCKEGPVESYKRMLPYTAAMGVFSAGMWSNSPVLKRGKDDDDARIKEIMHRCKEIVEETVKAYDWK